MRVLITGGYGFIGSSVGETFRAEGHDISIIDNLSSGSEKNAGFKHKFFRLNAGDPACEKVFQSSRFDVVIHLAEQPNRDKASEDQFAEPEANISGLANILQLSKKYGVKKVVIASSASVYGNHEKMPLKEETTCDPSSLSGVDKWISEQYCRKWDGDHGLDILCFRISNVYGPKQSTAGERGVVSLLMEQILLGKNLTIYGDGEQTRDFIYVEDVAEAIYRSVEKGLTGIYNLSTNEETSINQLIDCLHISTAGGVNQTVHQAARKEEIKYSRLDNSKLKKDLDWEPFHSLQEGLEKTYNWFTVNYSEKQQKKSESKKKGTAFLNPIAPYLGNITLFALVILLSSFVQDYLYMLDYQLFYIVAAAFLFGRKQLALSIGLSSIWFIYGSILSGRELISLIVDHNSLIHIGLYMSVGLTIGYVLNKKEKLIADARSEADYIKERHQSLDSVYRETVTINDELKNQVLYTNTSIGTTYNVMKELDHLDPFKIYAASINVVEHVMKSNQVAFYIVDQSHEKLRLVTQSAGFEAQPVLSITKDENLLKVKESNKMYVNKELDSDYPSMISPVSIDGSFIGVLMISSPDFENVTLYKQNLFLIATDLIASALNCAYQHQEAVTDGKVSVKVPVYNEEEAYA